VVFRASPAKSSADRLPVYLELMFDANRASFSGASVAKTTPTKSQEICLLRACCQYLSADYVRFYYVFLYSILYLSML